MNKLDSKYRGDNLTREELLDLRGQINSMDDTEMASLLEGSWNDYNPENITAPDRCYSNIMKVVHNTSPSKKTDIIKRIAQIAAAIIIPLLIGTSFYLYNQVEIANSNTTTITTDIGERANITLPDGTKVVINSESTLSYTAKTFNKSSRIVEFEGEAHFNIKKNDDAPFLINTADVNVKVLGTIFNLCARNRDNIVHLDLEQGSVLFTSIKSRKECVVSPNSSIELNKLTGEITLLSATEMKSISPWRKGELNFKNATLQEVISVIESNYDVTITTVGEIKTSKDLFTGTIPNNNITEAIEVLEKSHNIKAKIIGKQITISDSKVIL